MSGDANTKTVVRMLMAWNDEKEERWLAEQARAGWRLKAVVDGQVPEIYTDPQSRIGKYRRVAALMGMMLAILVTQTAPRLAIGRQPASTLGRFPAILAIQLALMAVIVYGIMRLLLVISRLRRSAGANTSLKEP